ncbi:MAG: hypothetical protein ABIG61_11610 [Planctomycetota bacterium]
MLKFMPDIFEILRKRWAEAILVAAFHLGVLILMIQLSERSTQPQNAAGLYTPGWLVFLMATAAAVVAVLWQMLSIGFLRTAYTGGTASQEPASLIITGRHFFWRMIRFQILFTVLYFAVSFIILELLNLLVFDRTGQKLSPKIIHLVMQLVFIILLKPMLLVPAIIIVRDCTVREGFGLMRNYRLRRAKMLLGVFFICFAVFFVLSFVQGLTKDKSLLGYVVAGANLTAAAALTLLIYLAATAFVASETDIQTRN